MVLCRELTKKYVKLLHSKWKLTLISVIKYFFEQNFGNISLFFIFQISVELLRFMKTSKIEYMCSFINLLNSIILYGYWISPLNLIYFQTWILYVIKDKNINTKLYFIASEFNWKLKIILDKVIGYANISYFLTSARLIVLRERARLHISERQ